MESKYKINEQSRNRLIDTGESLVVAMGEVGGRHGGDEGDKETQNFQL